jgi:hypothetical protein
LTLCHKTKRSPTIVPTVSCILNIAGRPPQIGAMNEAHNNPESAGRCVMSADRASQFDRRK